MDSLKTILADISKPKPTSPARLSTLVPKAEPIPATFVDLVDECNHGHGITRYMRTALYMMPGPWFTKHGVSTSDCIFDRQWPYFEALDAKCRGFHKANPTYTLQEVVKKFI